MELKQFGIDVVIIESGAIVTEWATISREHMMKVSGNGPYKELVKKHFKMYERLIKEAANPLWWLKPL